MGLMSKYNPLMMTNHITRETYWKIIKLQNRLKAARAIGGWTASNAEMTLKPEIDYLVAQFLAQIEITNEIEYWVAKGFREGQGIEPPCGGYKE